MTGDTRNDKSVYGIEIDFGALPNNTTKSIDIPGYNANCTYWIDTSRTYSYRLSDKASITLPKPGGSSTDAILIQVGSGKVTVITFMNWSAFTETKIVINYTK